MVCDFPDWIEDHWLTSTVELVQNPGVWKSEFCRYPVTSLTILGILASLSPRPTSDRGYGVSLQYVYSYGYISMQCANFFP